MASLNSSPAWKALKTHAGKTATAHLRQLFAADPKRFKRLSLAVGSLFLDYSKNRITPETLRLLTRLAREADVASWRRRLFKGEAVNVSEGRAALHVALRARPGDRVGDRDAFARGLRERRRVKRFADDIAAGRRTGAGGRPFRAAVVLGIGGSHLGPAMAVAALAPYRRPDFDARFVSSMDSAALSRGLDGLEPATTLVVVASKTFTTEETMANARAVRAWLAKALGERQALKQMAAVSADTAAVDRFGIACDDTFQIWDWVGGRFSLTSAMGLPLALAIGGKRFDEFLDGARAIDRHFLAAPLERNMPAILALVGVWNADFLSLPGLAVVPYDDRLRHFPAYLQQLEMESNGKSVDRLGQPLESGGAPIIFGGPGTGAQHAFFQSLHQGRQPIAADFIAVAEDGPTAGFHPGGDHRQRLNANMLAQAEALMAGRPMAEAKKALRAAGIKGAGWKWLAPHWTFAGNRPSNVILLGRLDPFALGQLVALYEHKVFVEAVIWGINPFDQWGVELGKELAAGILPALKSKAPKGRQATHDASTAGLIRRLKAKKWGRRPSKRLGKQR
ncbi:MAG: glucose-6-phosphate isomerase [Rhodospirillales bacterium]|nr:glucose-6-phosphate isomerase [Rhodospirillales bacterium]